MKKALTLKELILILTLPQLSLKITSKQSQRCAKIYYVGWKGKFLKFEMEFRRNFIANYKSNLLNNDSEKLEDSLIREFLNYFWKLLPKIRIIVNPGQKGAPEL